MEINKLYNIDCFDGHKIIEDKSIDLIYTDLPYNNTKNSWDSAIDLDLIWSDYKRIIKPRGIIVLHAQGMFSAKIMMSNKKWWRYNIIWKKGDRVSGFLNANRQPLRNHEDILVFYPKPGTYNPQFTEGQPLHGKGTKYKTKDNTNNNYGYYDATKDDTRKGFTQKYPKSVLNFERPHPPIHPTQKPIELCEWIVKTYSNEGDLVLDSTSGSGSIPIACKNTNRNWIAFETDEEYFDLAEKRINSNEV